MSRPHRPFSPTSFVRATPVASVLRIDLAVARYPAPDGLFSIENQPAESPPLIDARSDSIHLRELGIHEEGISNTPPGDHLPSGHPALWTSPVRGMPAQVLRFVAGTDLSPTQNKENLMRTGIDPRDEIRVYDPGYVDGAADIVLTRPILTLMGLNETQPILVRVRDDHPKQIEILGQPLPTSPQTPTRSPPGPIPTTTLISRPDSTASCRPDGS